MGRFVQHEGCPRCGSRNNLGRYADGSAWCFGCHYRESATGAPSGYLGSTKHEDDRRYATIPDDAGCDYGRACVEWLASYHTSIPTAIRRGLLWSPSREQLIYQLGDLWQARNFRVGAKSKNFTSGDVNECTFIYGCCTNDNNSSGDGSGIQAGTLVIVEDPLSALRIASQSDSMPLLGSHLAPKRLNAVAGLYSSLMFWLDSDKYKEARGMEQRAKMMGLTARTIYTDLDPKCYTDDQLKEILCEQFT